MLFACTGAVPTLCFVCAESLRHGLHKHGNDSAGHAISLRAWSWHSPLSPLTSDIITFTQLVLDMVSPMTQIFHCASALDQVLMHDCLWNWEWLSPCSCAVDPKSRCRLCCGFWEVTWRAGVQASGPARQEPAQYRPPGGECCCWRCLPHDRGSCHRGGCPGGHHSAWRGHGRSHDCLHWRSATSTESGFCL